MGTRKLRKRGEEGIALRMVEGIGWVDGVMMEENDELEVSLQGKIMPYARRAREGAISRVSDAL